VFFRIADTFTDSLARLTGEEQKAVKTTAFDLQVNPASPGMQLHKLDKSKDKNFLSARVSSDIRLIVHRTDSSLLLGHVDHHDAAYRWAEPRTLETHPNTGEVRSDGPDGIGCWFVDTDYNEESFFVRHAYFLGANGPYSALKTTFEVEINAETWATLHSNVSRPFEKPQSGRIAVKVINHLGDEVMKVFRA